MHAVWQPRCTLISFDVGKLNMAVVVMRVEERVCVGGGRDAAPTSPAPPPPTSRKRARRANKKPPPSPLVSVPIEKRTPVIERVLRTIVNSGGVDCDEKDGADTGECLDERVVLVGARNVSVTRSSPPGTVPATGRAATLVCDLHDTLDALGRELQWCPTSLCPTTFVAVETQLSSVFRELAFGVLAYFSHTARLTPSGVFAWHLLDVPATHKLTVCRVVAGMAAAQACPDTPTDAGGAASWRRNKRDAVRAVGALHAMALRSPHHKPCGVIAAAENDHNISDAFLQGVYVLAAMWFGWNAAPPRQNPRCRTCPCSCYCRSRVAVTDGPVTRRCSVGAGAGGVVVLVDDDDGVEEE
jgi:hypothetical protein